MTKPFTSKIQQKVNIYTKRNEELNYHRID